MQSWISIGMAIALIGCAAGMMFWHVRSWRRAAGARLDADERDYRRRQFRRRMQTSAMLALLAVLLGVGPWIGQRPGWVAAYTAAVLILVVWICLLAAVDALATRLHYGRLRHECFVERAKLQAQLRRAESVRGNGHGPIKNHRQRRP